MHGGLRWEKGRPSSIRDFSVNLNPLGVPKFLEELIEEAVRSKVYSFYPDDYRELKRVISEIYDVNEEIIAVFNGASEAISLLDRDFFVPEPNYQEYPRGWIYLAHEDEEFRFTLQGNKVITSHPNNPTGASLSRDDVISFLQEGKILVLDQSFADISPVDSFVDLAEEFPNLLVISSFTKAFSVPGLRLGFTIGNMSRILERHAPPWRVNGIAYYAFSNINPREAKNFFSKSREEVKVSLDRIGRIHGLRVYKSHAPYVLAEAPVPAERLNHELLRRGYYVRNCSNFVGLRGNHFRFSLRIDFPELILVLQEILQELEIPS
ncbi:pyridoxal phosphate-dependent aminotransferase [Metallosphaera javensis (ex Sakai et al. 2022)]|uniref:pyridoxal phosphate-dependent aminotransferase n=1 Tax=Metallosphaera javensis (ex Sakai et al. 2022) TaxID=2775498 RepID=UPI0025881DD3|nr:MAG: aromatic-amino-acid aminotransferase 2 [Metallosphaera javensis (ex Sakai et al. 2022)]